MKGFLHIIITVYIYFIDILKDPPYWENLISIRLTIQQNAHIAGSQKNTTLSLFSRRHLRDTIALRKGYLAIHDPDVGNITRRRTQ
jgi:hypothetical protein